MNVIDRIQADQLAIKAGVNNPLWAAVAAADVSLRDAGEPTYSELVTTLLHWNRTSDQCKSVGHAAHRERRARTPGELIEVRRLEEERRAATRAINNLIDRLPRGL